MSLTISAPGLVDVTENRRDTRNARCFTYDFGRRWYQHLRTSWWLGEIRVAAVNVIGYTTRLGARLSEAAMINEQSTVYNTAHEEAAYREYLRLQEDDSWPGLGVVSHHLLVPSLEGDAA